MENIVFSVCKRRITRPRADCIRTTYHTQNHPPGDLPNRYTYYYVRSERILKVIRVHTRGVLRVVFGITYRGVLEV